MSEFKCTVLLVSYNAVETIERAILSVLEQKTKYKYKIHAFDDCSTDGTQEIILKYAKKYPDIVFPFIAEKNGGAQTNFWNAFSSVDTEYCAELEGDDFWCCPQKIELQINALEKHPECSFCGHDTYLFYEDADCKEYEQGSTAMTCPILHDKNIFSYKDFYPIKTGGYIPYVTARMIRSSAMKLDKVKYKEAFLFDFTMFYYLLLEGDYYYIDLPMSVYVRNGKGICSGKSPVVFLNDFLQASIDFNKQTHNVIADKIYSDCFLQIDFRLKLFEQSKFKTTNSLALNNRSALCENIRINDSKLLIMKNELSQNKYYFLCNGGIGFTVFICSIKSELEKHLGNDVVLLLKPAHEFIAKIFSAGDYLLIDTDSINIDYLSNQVPYPTLGEIYVAHPFSHMESANYFMPIIRLSSPERYGAWLLKFYGLSENLAIKAPEKNLELSDNIFEKLKRFGDISKIVLFFPEAYTLACVSHRKWKKKANELKAKGLTVLSCVIEKRNTISGTHYIDVTAEEAYALGMRCHSVYTVRNGMADLLAVRGENLHVLYSSHAAHYIYSINGMLQRNDIDEIIELEIDNSSFYLGYVPQNAVQLPDRRKAYILGFIPVPHWLYNFYIRHKDRLYKFKKFVKWH